MSFWHKLKQRWHVKSNTQIVMILVVFAVTGFSILYVKKPVFAWCKYHHINNTFLKSLAYIGIMYPLYQILLIIFGTLLGQYAFFSKFLIRMNTRLFNPFRKKTNNND